jgi:L-histidine N-alpha-methyltransferase
MGNLAGKVNAAELITVSNFLPQIGSGEVVGEIIAGLTSEQKYISSKFFYDEKGSMLFEKITQLKEYYLTRTEVSILDRVASTFFNELMNFNIVELGSGDCNKISILLGAIPACNRERVRYFPVDISRSAIQESADKLLSIFPDIKVHGIIVDFISQFNLIPKMPGRLICFFGSTIGNLDIEHSSQFLAKLSGNMETGDQLLIGFDMVKSKNIIEKAYNDSEQITAAFNKNILSVVNSIVNTNFDLTQFEHIAFFNEEKSRIEMHLRATADLNVVCPILSQKIRIKKGETIHTENSYKYTLNNISDFAVSGGLTIKNIFSDSNKWFALVLFVK